MQLYDDDTTTDNQERKYSAFFYGTLLHPRVLKRVLNRGGDDLEIAPAILDGYIRHRVRWADFPAVVLASTSHDFFKTGSSSADVDCVRGCYVSGLTEADMIRLDRFESGLYARKEIELRLLLEPVHGLDAIDLQSLIDPKMEGIHSAEVQTRKALTYVWSQSLYKLEAEPWSFTDFVAQKLEYWG
ncbi:hypothetical protein FRC14_001065 [Serendipita sp. 396]|nr:hypothetical protein FRC14_001065 [Serendipita sp. 396]KAG8849005.1 hypothetical protein FRC20_002400 [Serendipita sp. 405]